MSLDEIVLQKLGDWRPSGSGRQTVNAADDESGWAVALTTDRCDDLSCAIWEMSQRRLTKASQSTIDLKAWAHQVAAQVNGLLEPLRVVEIDPERNEALLRSNEPTARKSELFYYEILLKGIGQALVRRFRAPSLEGRREQIPFTLTHEAVAKLAADLVF